MWLTNHLLVPQNICGFLGKFCQLPTVVMSLSCIIVLFSNRCMNFNSFAVANIFCQQLFVPKKWYNLSYVIVSINYCGISQTQLMLTEENWGWFKRPTVIERRSVTNCSLLLLWLYDSKSCNITIITACLNVSFVIIHTFPCVWQ